MNAPSNDRAVAAGHTPGPWVESEDEGSATLFIYSPSAAYVVARVSSSVITERNRADARLIATAPDFAAVAPDAVELLNRYATYIRDYVRADDLEMHPHLPELERVADTIAAALSKARAGGDL